MDGTNLAGVYVEVGADLSELGAQLQGAVKEATDAGQQIGDALEQGVKSSGGLEEIGNEIRAIGPQLTELGTGFSELGKGMLVGGAALTEISEGIADIAKESLDFTGKIQLATASLTTFFGSGQKAAEVLEQIKGIEQSSIFSFPQLAGAAQQLAALGVAAEKIPDTLKAVALAAEATGGSLDGATAALARIQATGQLSQRALLALGLSWADLGKQMGLSAEQAKEALSKGLGDASQILDTVTAAITAKTKGLTEELATSIPVALNQLKSAWDDVLGKLGPTIAPVMSQVANAIKSVLATIGPLIDEFNALPTPVKDVAFAVTALFVAIGPLTVALGAFLFAGGEILESVPKIAEAFTALKASVAGAEVAQAGAAVAEVGTAAEGAAVGVGALGAAASVAGLALGGILALGFGAAIGAWIGNLEAVQNAFQRAFDFTGITTLIQKFEGATEANKQFQESTDALAAKLASMGIIVDRGGLSLEDYAKKLQAAALAQGNLNAAADTMGSHFSQAALDIINSSVSLEQKLAKAKATLAELTDAEKDNANYAPAVAMAQAKVTSILSELGDKSVETAKKMAALAAEEQKDFTEVYELIGKQPQLSTEPFDATIANIKAYEKELSDSGQLTTEAMAIIQSQIDAATNNYAADMKTITDATAKGFKFDQAIAQIQKLIDKLSEGKNADSAYTQNLIADLQLQQNALRNGQQEFAAYQNAVAYAGTETQKLINVDQALTAAHSGLMGTVQNGVTVLGSTAKIFDMVTSSGDGTVQMIVGRMSPGFVTLADAAAKAGMSIQDFQAKTQEAALDAQAAMGNIGAASDSLVLKIKTGQADSIKALQAALGAYGDLRDEVNQGSASQQELARAIQMVQSAAGAAGVNLANVGQVMGLDADQQQKLTQALLAGGNAFRDIGAAAAGAASDMDAYFTAADNASSLGMPQLDGSGFTQSVGKGQTVVQHFGAGGNVGGGFAQDIEIVGGGNNAASFPIGSNFGENANPPGTSGSGGAPALSADQLKASQGAMAGLTSVMSTIPGLANLSTSATKASTTATVAQTAATDAATQTATNLQGELDSLSAQMKNGSDRAKILKQQMQAMADAGQDQSAEYRSLASQLDAVNTLNAQLSDTYDSVQKQLGDTTDSLNTFADSVASVGAAIGTAAKTAAAGIVDLGDATLPSTVTPGSGLGTLNQGGPLAGTAMLGDLVNVNGMLVPAPAPTIHLNMNGAIITSQGAADQLFTTAVDILKRDTALKL